jgi:hypothetical protein
MHRFLVNVRLAKNKIKAYWGSPYGNTINDNIHDIAPLTITFTSKIRPNIHDIAPLTITFTIGLIGFSVGCS